MAGTKVVFFDSREFEEDYLKNNKPQNCEFIFIKDPIHENFEQNIEKTKDAEIVSIFTSSRLKEEHINAMQNVKLVCARSTGFSHINIEYCKQKNIPVVNVPRYGDCTVAEFAFGLLLEVTRKISIAYENLQKGIIKTHNYIGLDMYGKTIGIIGTGAIGAHAVKIANGFGMKIFAYDPFPKQELVEKYGVKYSSIEELYRNADFISIHAPSTKENFHMINENAFEQMKDGVIIINTARGEIIKTEDLYKYLLNGKVAGAGLDVLECEEIITSKDYISKIDCVNTNCLAKTLINHKFLELPNVIVTPHIAFDTKEAVDRISETTIKNISSYLNGEIINRVN